jgi:hypothetical protein
MSKLYLGKTTFSGESPKKMISYGTTPPLVELLASGNEFSYFMGISAYINLMH